MGKNRRQERLRQRRDGGGPATPSPAPSRPVTASKPGWRRTLDSWGGLPVVGSIAVSLIVVAVLVWVNRPGASTNTEPYEPVARSVVNGRVEGDPNAPVKIIEFSDFQCPFCRRFTLETAPLLVQEFVETGIASIEYRHMAFLGPESVQAAEAAECAADQNRFWDYHDVLFLRQGQENAGVYSEANLKKYAREVADAHDDFDVGAFESCLVSGEKRAAVEAMTAQAGELGIRSTPSFLVNGQPISGAQGIDVFRQVIQAAQAGQ